MTVVGWCIIVMGISLDLVVTLWLWIGHIGASYSSDLLIKQQEKLRPQFGLPAKIVVSDPKILLTPPSLRNASLMNCIPYSYWQSAAIVPIDSYSPLEVTRLSNLNIKPCFTDNLQIHVYYAIGKENTPDCRFFINVLVD